MKRAHYYQIIYKIAKTINIAFLALLVYATVLNLFEVDIFINHLTKLLASILLLTTLYIVYRLTLKHPRIGGLLQILISVIFTLYFATYTNLVNFILISLPLLLAGLLFIYYDLNSIS